MPVCIQPNHDSEQFYVPETDRQTLIVASLRVIIIKGVITAQPTHTHAHINTHKCRMRQ